MTAQAAMKDAEQRMEKAIEKLRNDLRGLRTGRASPAMLDGLRVEYYGTPTPIKQIANITTPDSSSLMIKPFSTDDLKEIEKAIRSSDLGLAPNNDGKVIRLTIPAMSGDQRKKMAQHIKKLGEDCKVSCRNIRRDANKVIEQAEKDKAISEDEMEKMKTKVQDLLKLYEGKVDEAANAKTKEVTEG